MRVKYSLLLLLILLLVSCGSRKHVSRTEFPKREFRGAWIQAVNGQFMGMDEKEMKSYLIDMLNNLQKVNVNAVIFQVRVEGDALYESRFEPWSRYMTGVQGRSPGWDPLAFMVNECHRRNMELHAWINPYRARTKGTKHVAYNHMTRKRPELFIEYEGQLYFNPALQSNREHICGVVRDIVNRYDVDGIHIDDYFYPTTDTSFDDIEYAKYKVTAGSSAMSLSNWRKENVNQLIKGIYSAVKSYGDLEFGVSPAANLDRCRNELYCDVEKWMSTTGYIDYIMPQTC